MTRVRVVLAPLAALLLAVSVSVVANPAATAGVSASPMTLNPRPTTDGHPLFVYRMFGADDQHALDAITPTVVDEYGAFLLSPSMKDVATKIKGLNQTEGRNDAVYMYKDISSTRWNPATECPSPNMNMDAQGVDWGVDFCDALANNHGWDWFLTIPNPPYADHVQFMYAQYLKNFAWETDPAGPGYATRWANNVLEDLRTDLGNGARWDGVFADNALANITAYVPGQPQSCHPPDPSTCVFPDQYQSFTAGHTAYKTFLGTAAQAIRNAGYGFMSNESGVRIYDGLWNDYTTPQTGGYDEAWATYCCDAGQPQYISDYGAHGYTADLAEATWSENNNPPKFSVFVPQVHAQDAPYPTCTECQRYGYASYLLVNDGTIGYQEGDGDRLPGDYVAANEMYRWDLGVPTVSRSRVTDTTSVFKRPFPAGLVLVDADSRQDQGNGNPQTVSLSGKYFDESGNCIMSSITMTMGRAHILRRAPANTTPCSTGGLNGWISP